MLDASTSWDIPEEMRMLQDTVRAFMREEVRPAEYGLDPDCFELPPDRLVPLQSKAKALGLWCVESPAEYGGA